MMQENSTKVTENQHKLNLILITLTLADTGFGIKISLVAFVWTTLVQKIRKIKVGIIKFPLYIFQHFELHTIMY